MPEVVIFLIINVLGVGVLINLEEYQYENSNLMKRIAWVCITISWITLLFKVIHGGLLK